MYIYSIISNRLILQWTNFWTFKKLPAALCVTAGKLYWIFFKYLMI